MSKDAEKFIKEYQEKHKTGAWDAKCTQAYADEEVKKHLIEYTKQLMDYTHESHNIIGHDDREPEEFIEIYLKQLEK